MILHTLGVQVAASRARLGLVGVIGLPLPIFF